MPSLERVKSLPGLREYRRWKYRRRFAREGTHNLFHGEYGSFAEALKDAPEGRPLGYDNDGAARMYEEHLDHTWPEHYPVLFWLSRRWSQHRHVLDFGGHRGSLFYSCRRLLGPGPRWTVLDVPSVVREGKESARLRGFSELAFEDDPSLLEDVDILVGAGSLQYVEYSAEEWLMRMGVSPRTVIVSTTPFHRNREFVTLNNMGTAYCAYKVRRNNDFFDELCGLGYELVEDWHHPGKRCEVPFHVPGGEVTYRGGCFTRYQES